MSLSRLQREFTRTQAQFIVWCFENGFEVVLAEAFRPTWVAEEYARRGIGIVNSNHTRKLAVDLFLFDGPRFINYWEPYIPLGDQWKSMHELARWGGDFANRDAVHFSFEYRGVR